MNIRIYFIAVLIILIGAAGCKKQDIPLKPVQTTTFLASLEGGVAIFPATKSTVNIIITAGTNGWSLTQNVANTWCVADKNYGAGDYKLKVTINANTTGADRTTQIKLLSTNSSLSAVLLNITQSK